MDTLVAHKPTAEQDAIVEDAFSTTSNMQVRALAGTGKTSTIEMVDRALPAGQPRLYLAFNKRIVEEIKDRGAIADTTMCKTLNSLGHGIWSKAIDAKIIVDTRGQKILHAFRAAISTYSKVDQNQFWESWDEIRTAVGLAKALGYIPEGASNWDRRLIDDDDFNAALESPLDPDQFDIVDQILKDSIKQSYRGTIDFNDQLYMPSLFGGAFPRFPVVMVDEAQDLSPVNHRMLEKLCRNARLFSVGDPFQSIYQFRGAMQNGMERQQAKFSMAIRPLSVSFRCPKAIVEAARWRVPGFQWIKLGGRVERLRELDLRSISEDAAFICCNNAPLVRLAVNLLSVSRPVDMAGTDIGPKLLNILRKFGDESLSRPAVLGHINDWQEKRSESKTAADMADCLRVFANLSKTLGEAIAYAEFLFKQTGRIHLTTGHKAKGLEWPVVYNLDPQLLGDDEQDLNLRYVIQTRSAGEFYEIRSDGIVK